MLFAAVRILFYFFVQVIFNYGEEYYKEIKLVNKNKKFPKTVKTSFKTTTIRKVVFYFIIWGIYSFLRLEDLLSPYYDNLYKINCCYLYD